jgi:hypothetical protein
LKARENAGQERLTIIFGSRIDLLLSTAGEQPTLSDVWALVDCRRMSGVDWSGVEWR